MEFAKEYSFLISEVEILRKFLTKEITGLLHQLNIFWVSINGLGEVGWLY
jgi:hypothetical protein